MTQGKERVSEARPSLGSRRERCLEMLAEFRVRGPKVTRQSDAARPRPKASWRSLECYMRASLFLVAGLVLAACSSSSNNPPTSSAPGNQLTIGFKNASASDLVRLSSNALKCIISATPPDIKLRAFEAVKEEIDASSCGGGAPSINFLVIVTSDNLVWGGVLRLTSRRTQTLNWFADLQGSGAFKLCTRPDLRTEVAIVQNQQIEFLKCQRVGASRGTRPLRFGTSSRRLAPVPTTCPAVCQARSRR